MGHILTCMVFLLIVATVMIFNEANREKWF